MREDQRARLKDLCEKLADVVLNEADPEEWPGAGVPAGEMSQEERGNRYWCKKNAAASFALLQRAEDLAAPPKASEGAAMEAREADLDKQIATAERKAGDVLNEVMRRTKKAAFDGRVHGKP